MRGIVKLKLGCGGGQLKPGHGFVIDHWVVLVIGLVRIVLARIHGERQGDILERGT